MPSVSARAPWPEMHDATARLKGGQRTTRPSSISGSKLLVASDMLALASAMLVSYLVASSTTEQAALRPGGVALFAAMLAAWLVGARQAGLYRWDGRAAVYRTVREWANLGLLLLVGLAALVAVVSVARLNGLLRKDLLVFAAAATAFVTVGRVATRALSSDCHVRWAIIVGAGEVGQLLARKLLRHPEYGIKLAGFVDTPPERLRPDVADVPVLGPVGELTSIVRKLEVDRVILAFSSLSDQATLTLVRPLVGLNVQVDVVPRMFEMIGPATRLPNVEGIPLVSITPRPRSAASLRIKRAIDVVAAAAGLVLAAPVFLWAAWRIPRESPGPVFYRQLRLGENRKEFTLLKFRTMSVDADQSSHRAFVERAMKGEHTAAAGELYKLDRRDVVTPTGRRLRRTSLDELPQLINVLRGDMSLVGPRPCLPYETEHFAPHHYERFLVPAGITGLWQVTARAHASFAEALEMDVLYVRDWSLALDLSLLLRTPVELLRQRKATV